MKRSCRSLVRFFLWIDLVLAILGVIPFLFGFDIFLLILCLKWFPQIQLGKIFGKNPELNIWCKSLAYGIAAILSATGIEYIFLIGMSYVTPKIIEDLLFTVEPSASFGEAILVVLIVPVFEEICFRGIFLQRALQTWGSRQSVLIVSAFFGILHIPHVASSFLFGVILSVITLQTSSIYIPIVLHILNNAVATGYEIFLADSAVQSLIELRSGFWDSVISAAIGIIPLWHLILGPGSPLQATKRKRKDSH